jgi:hypothetical protein
MFQEHYIHVAYCTSIDTARIVTGLNYEKKYGDPITACFPYNLSLPEKKKTQRYALEKNHITVPRTFITYNS